MKGILKYIAVLSVLTMFSCSEYQKTMKAEDPEKKFTLAKKFFDEENYTRASLLLEDILVDFRNTEKAEEISYMYAYCQYKTGNLLVASFRFKSLYDIYPNGKYAEESLYLFAYTLYFESPPVNLDQSYTEKAIEALQLFINRFPESDKVEKCNKLMDDLLGKLEEKDIRTAKVWYKVEDYKAAATALSNLLEKYPSTSHKHELQYLILDSYYRLALNSIEKRQEERFNNTIDFYNENKSDLLASEYADRAKNIYEKVLIKTNGR
jgi:outer membrane protein assembly factor BamD